MTIATTEQPTNVDALATRLHTERAGTIDLTTQQVAYLLGELRSDRVRNHQGNSYLEGWDVRRTLTRIFGFGGWELTTTELKCIREHSVPSGADKKKFRWWATYRAQVRLTVFTRDGRKIAHFEDGSAGESANQPSHGDCHDMALKTALTGALKRCAVNLGDQLGLSLYRNGSTEPVVLGGLPYMEDTNTTEVAEGPGVAEEPADMSEVGGTQEAPEEEPQPSAVSAAPEPAPAPAGPVESLEDWKDRFTQQIPDATAGQLAQFETEAKGLVRTKKLTPQEANYVITQVNRRRAALKKGDAGDTA